MIPSIEIIINALGWTLLHSVWQGAIVGVLFAVTRTALRSANPTVRHSNALTWLILFLSLPVLTFVSLMLEAPVSSQSALLQPVIPTVPLTAWSGPTTSWLQSLLPVLTCCWGLGVGYLLHRLWRDWRRLDRITCADCQPLPQLNERLDALRASMNVRMNVGLVEAANATVPMVVGFIKPMIVLPSSALLGLTPRELEMIIAHELAHLRRSDHLVNYVLIAAETLFFYHPVVFTLTRTIRHERELCCDDLVIRTFNERVCYAHALSKLETLRGIELVPSSTLQLAATDGPLVTRIARMVGQRTHKRWGVAPAIMLPLITVLFVASVFHQSPLTANGKNAVSEVAAIADLGLKESGIQLSAAPTETAELLQPVELNYYERRSVAAEAVSKITYALTKSSAPRPFKAIETGARLVASTPASLNNSTNGSTTSTAAATPTYAPQRSASEEFKKIDQNSFSEQRLKRSSQGENASVSDVTKTTFQTLDNADYLTSTGSRSEQATRFASRSLVSKLELIEDASQQFASSIAKGASASPSRVAYDVPQTDANGMSFSGQETLSAFLSSEKRSNDAATFSGDTQEIVDVLSGGELIHSVTPRYPIRARSRGLVDKVVVSIQIDATGAVHDVSVIDGNSRRMFQKAVVKAVSQWKFEPLLRNGEPVEQTVEQSFNFQLQPYSARGPSQTCSDTKGRICRLAT